MQQNPPPPPPPPPHPETTPHAAHIAGDGGVTASPLFDWSDFLEFSLDENLTIPFPDPDPQPGPDENPVNRVRKRDPKLVCPNYLAGRIPCACPEMDAAMLDEQEDDETSSFLLGKKQRTGMVRGGGAVGPAQGRCQVAGCEADISELKGYHKRHRVCLRCANASSVVIDGENKRYCQQCGKFHLLSDFDEGKRSCRRKLERHNNRRRRNQNGSKRGTSILDDGGGNDAGKDDICLNNQNEKTEILLDLDRNIPTISSAPVCTQNDSFVSFEGHANIEKQNSKYKRSSSYSENKNTYSSTCPSGRISFKLYDWNPADFPRRLRHQIFDWLASMPVELEGYIRPGCTILTAFIAMPKPMWNKLLEEPSSCIKDLVASPRSMLSGRGTMLVYLNDKIFSVTNDATSVVKVKVKDRAPKLHYVYPTCFVAGKPIEFTACGSDLLQPKFRFLVSFAGKYLVYNISVSSQHCEKRGTNSFDHQLLRICIPQTDLDLYGPAFIEVENHSGLSNFIPILIGDEEICAEMEILQQKFVTRENLQARPNPGCEVFALRQAQFLEFVLEVAWSLKKPVSDTQFTSFHAQNFNNLLNFLIKNESCVVLQRVMCSLRYAIDKNLVSGDIMTLLQTNIDIAESMIADESIYSRSSRKDDRFVIAANDDEKNMLGARVFTNAGEIIPLLNNEVVMNVSVQEKPKNLLYQRSFTRTFLTSRPILVAISALCVCFGVCSVLIHPQRVSQIATTIRRCLFDKS